MNYADRLRRSDWEVKAVPIDVATALVQTYHYSHGAVIVGRFSKLKFVHIV